MTPECVRASNGLTSVPFSTLLSGIRAPAKKSPSWKLGTMPVYPWFGASVHCQPTELFEQANHIFPHKNPRSSHLLVTTKPASHRPLPGHVSQDQLLRGTWCAVSSSLMLWVHVSNKLLSISLVQCWVSCVWPSP